MIGRQKWIGRPTRAAALIAVGAAGAGAAIAVASVPDSGGTIHACVQLNGTVPFDGPNLRVIDPNANPPQTCNTVAGGVLEEPLSWNTVGRQGVQGVPGATGAQGPPGAEGRTLTINGQTFSISGLNKTGTIVGLPLVAPLQPNTRGKPIASLTGLDLGGGAPPTIEVDSWSFGASNSGSQSFGSGAGSGKASFHDLQITKSVDKASPLLFKACASGTHFKKVVLAVRKAGREKPYLTLTMQDVLISSYQESNGGGRPTESVSFNFAKIEYDYKPQK